MLSIKRGILNSATGADQLSAAAANFFNAHKSCYGVEHVKPKHHWLMDLASQVRRDGALIDAFIIERRHLMVKALAEPVRNTKQYEISVLSGLLTVQLHDVKELVVGDRLIGSCSVLQEDSNVSVANKAEVYGFTVTVGDVIVRGAEAAVVTACAQDCGGLFFFVSPLAFVSRVTAQASLFRRLGGLTAWRPADVQHSLAWRDEPAGLLVLGR